VIFKTLNGNYKNLSVFYCTAPRDNTQKGND
jgi:hypothetical protein